MFRHHQWPRGRPFGLAPWGRPGRHHHHWGGPPPWARRGFGHGGRRFGRGDLKYVVLDLLRDQPRHGYDIIRALEERFHGFYSPSPGSVYPTLQLLEDQGYVTSAERDGKRIYSITDEGRAFLRERADALHDVQSRVSEHWGRSMTPEMRDLLDEIRQLAQVVFRNAGRGDLSKPEKITRLHDAVRRARIEIETSFSADAEKGDTEEPVSV